MQPEIIRISLFQYLEINHLDKDSNYAVKKELYPMFRALDFFLDENFIKHMASANSKNTNWNFEFHSIQPLSVLQSKVKLNFLSSNNSFTINSFPAAIGSSTSSASSSLSAASSSSSSNPDEIANLRLELDQLRSLLNQQNSQQNLAHFATSSVRPHH
jgi:hypothetical protein